MNAAVGPGVSVVIPTYGRREMLPPVLAPLLADPATREIVVVVDGSTDGSLELLADMARDEPRLRPLRVERGGPAKARQVGVEAAAAAVVLLMEDDVIAEDGLVSGHAEHHRTGERLVVMGYMPVEASDDNLAGRLYARDYEQSCRHLDRHADQVLLNLWGANVSLRRRDCLRVGVHHPLFTVQGHEDWDFGLRCLRAGLVGRFDRSLRARHLYTRSLEPFLLDCRRQGAARVLIHRQHGDLVGPLDPRVFEHGLRRPARAALRACRREGVRRPVERALRGVVTVDSLPRLAALDLLRRIENQRGALGVDA